MYSVSTSSKKLNYYSQHEILNISEDESLPLPIRKVEFDELHLCQSKRFLW